MDTRSRALLALGLLLVSVPLWAPVADVTGEDHIYRTTGVTAGDGELRLNTTDSFYFTGPTDQLACASSLPPVATDRGCYLESRLRDGNVSVRYPSVASYGGDPEVGSPRYVVFGPAGPVYERTVGYDEREEAFVLGLERVDPETALADVSADPERAPAAIREALRTGEVRTDEPLALDGPRLYEDGDGYTVVYDVGSTVFLSSKPGLERGLEGVAVALGAVLCVRAGRHDGATTGR